MTPPLHLRLVFWLLIAGGYFVPVPAAWSQLDGACYYCKSRNENIHYRGCPYYTGSTTSPGRDYDPPVVIPQPTQAELDARRALEWYNDAARDIDSYERTQNRQALRSAMEKLFNAEALLRNWSPNQARYLKLVNGNIAWCYNAYGRINYDNRRWDDAAKYFRLASKYNPGSEAYRGNIQNVEKARQVEQIKSIDSSAREAYARGNALWDQGNWEQTVRAYEESLRLARLAASMGGGEVWDGYQKALGRARANHEIVLAANDQMRAAAAERQRLEQETAEKHRQEVAVLTGKTREYARRQTDLRDAVVNERKQAAAEHLVEVKTPFGTDSYVGFQGQQQRGAVVHETTAYNQLWALTRHLEQAVTELQTEGGDESLDRIGYLLQQGQNAMNGGLYRGASSPGDTLKPIDPQKTQKLRSAMEQVIPVAIRQTEEVRTARKKKEETWQKAEEAKEEAQTARAEVAKATARVAEIMAMPEDTEEAKKKKADHGAEARALLAAATKQEKEAETLKTQAEDDKGKAEVELVKARAAFKTTENKLDFLLKNGELPEEKPKKGGNEPPPPGQSGRP